MYLFEEQSCQISARSNLKRQRLRFLEDSRPNKKKNKMSSDMGTVPDPKITQYFIHDLRNNHTFRHTNWKTDRDKTTTSS